MLVAVENSAANPRTLLESELLNVVELDDVRRVSEIHSEARSEKEELVVRHLSDCAEWTGFRVVRTEASRSSLGLGLVAGLAAGRPLRVEHASRTAPSCRRR